jgi:hypothetical protein
MSTTKLTINKNGSIKIEGDFEITDCNGQTYGLEGRTGSLPLWFICQQTFCDGAHRNGFEHEPAAFDLPPVKTK